MTRNADRTGRTGQRIFFGTILLGVSLLAVGCGGKTPDDLGAKGATLGDCPSSPNCVSSAADDEGHAIAALAIDGPQEAAWAALREVVSGGERVSVETDSEGYLYAVYTSKLMGYNDDVEFLANSASRQIEVRSASRVGYGDGGVNRDRIEAVRSALVSRGVVRSGADD